MSHTTDEKGQVLIKPDVAELEERIRKGDISTQELLGVLVVLATKIETHLSIITEETVRDSEIREGHGVGR